MTHISANMPSLRSFLILFMCSYLHSPVIAETESQYEDDYYESDLITPLKNFKKEASLAKKEKKIILVEFSTPWCEYCEALEKEVLEPLIRSRRYHDKVIIRKLEINDYSSVTGFDGKQYGAEEISMQYKIDLYPTLLFFDGEGNEISHRMVGIVTFDYIGEELDSAIGKALTTLLK